MGELNIKLVIFVLVSKNRLWQVFSVAAFGAWIEWNLSKLYKGDKLHKLHWLLVEDRGLRP